MKSLACSMCRLRSMGECVGCRFQGLTRVELPFAFSTLNLELTIPKYQYENNLIKPMEILK